MIDFKKDYVKQLKEFSADNSAVEEFNYYGVKVKDDYVLIRLHRVTYEDKSISTELWMPDPLTGDFKKGTSNKKDVVTHICKIISVGDGCSKSIEPGMIGTVQPDQVLGEVKNPKMELYIASVNAQGATPIEPDDTRVNIPKVELNFGYYKFHRPWVEEIEDVDRLTFVIPKSELITWGLEI